MEAKRKGLTTDEMISQYKKELENDSPSKKVVKITFKVIFKRVITILSLMFIVFLSFVIINVMLSKSSGDIPSLFGYYIFEVKTESMTPTLPVGSKIICKEAKQGEILSIGTIVTFEDLSGRIVTHRIIKIVNENNSIGYITKGDNILNDPDNETLTPDRIIAVFKKKL